MADAALGRWTRAAGWAVAVPAALVAVGSLVGLVLLGPFALLALPFVLPPLVVVIAQARTGFRVGRGRDSSTRSLFLLTLLVAVMVGALAVFERSEDGGGADESNVVLGLLACCEALAAGALAPSAWRRYERWSRARLVGTALAVLAVAQTSFLLMPRASDAPVP